MGDPVALKMLSGRVGCAVFSVTLLPRCPYLRKYSDCPVFDGILWLYLAGVGTSDTLTVLVDGYFFKLDSSGSFRLVF